jgi:hypothetical protein
MTRDQIIEKVARVMCRAQCDHRGTMACDGIFNFDDGCSGYTEFLEAARATIATLESTGYHIARIGNMVAPPVEGYAMSERLKRLTIKLLAIIDDARARGLELDTIVEFHETLTRMSFEVEVPVSVHPRRKPPAPPA